MKSVICTRYGAPEVLKVAEVEKPVPREGEVLIKIVASAVNSADVRVRGPAGNGLMRIAMRLMLGFRRPRKPILGSVFSGVVEQVGSKVKNFKVGDEVVGLTGMKFGAHSEYIVLPNDAVIARKPANATFEEAAAILFGGQTAIYFLEERAGISKMTNPRVLVYGATGSVGTAAIQIANHFGARVTAVCSERGESLAKELGADSIVRYDKDDFTKSGEKYDIVFDAVGKTTKKQCTPLLNDGGRYLTVGGLDSAAERWEQLELLRELFEAGKYTATIDKTYSMSEIVEAHRYVDTGRKKGNVVLKIGEI